MNILVINGSARKQANTRKVALAAANYLKQHITSANITTFDVGIDTLPIMDGEEASYTHPNVQKLTELAGQADGFFICTPEYHNGMSGSLKNALDFLSFHQFSQKPVSIGAASGGGKGGMNALNNVRIVMRGVGALVLPQQVVVDPIDFSENDLTQSAQERLNATLDELVSYLKLKVQL